MGFFSQFFGLGKTGTTDRTQIPAIANWQNQQSQGWGNNANNAWNKGQGLSDWASGYYQDLSRTGGVAGDPNNNWDMGRQVMPGVQDAINNRWNNLNQIQSNWNNFSGSPWGAQGTSDQLNNATDAMGGNITGNDQAVKGDIGDTFGRLGTANQNTSGDIQKSIAGTYGSIGNNLNNDYGRMLTDTNSTYGGLANATGSTYQTALDRLRMLQPGGELQRAQVSRSFAPQAAATADRLRAAGVDPNSLQAAGVMSGVDRDRARAMDEAAGRTTQDYVTQANNLGIGQLNTGIGLGQNRLNTANQLQGTENQLSANYAQNAGNQSRAELLRSLQNSQGLDLSRLGQNTAASNRTADQTNNYLQQRMANALGSRALGLQDYNTQTGLLNQRNQEELLGPAALYQQYQAGQGQNAYRQGQQNIGAAGVAGQGGQQLQAGLGAGGLGLGYSNAAVQNYLRSLGIESQNAGWGSKLIGGLLSGGFGGGFGGGTNPGITSGSGDFSGALGNGDFSGGGGGGGMNMQQMMQLAAMFG